MGLTLVAAGATPAAAQGPDGATVTGTVRSAGEPAARVNVTLEPLASCPALPSAQAQTDAVGRYSFPAVPAGDYRVRLSSVGHPDPQYVRGTYEPQAAETVTVPDAGTVEVAPAELLPGGRITGSLTDEAGRAADSVFASAVRVDDDSYSWHPGSHAGADGSFEVRGLRPGRYLLYATEMWESPSNLGMAAGFYRAGSRTLVPSRQEATVLEVQEGGAVAGVDVVVTRGGSISGRVTAGAGGSAAPSQAGVAATSSSTGPSPVEDVAVRAFPVEGGNYVAGRETRTAADGTYTLRGLASGTYRLSFWDRHDRYGSSRSPALIEVVAPQDALAPDHALRVGGTVSGRLTDATGQPAAAGSLVALMSEHELLNGYPDADGRYVIRHVPPGTYKLYFSRSSEQGHAEVYYRDQPDHDRAQPITVGEDETVTGLDQQLPAPTPFADPCAPPSPGQATPSSEPSATPTARTAPPVRGPEPAPADPTPLPSDGGARDGTASPAPASGTPSPAPDAVQESSAPTEGAAPPSSSPAPAAQEETQQVAREAVDALPDTASEPLRNGVGNALAAAVQSVAGTGMPQEQQVAAVAAVAAVAGAVASDARLSDDQRVAAVHTASELAAALASLPEPVTRAVRTALADGLVAVAVTGALSTPGVGAAVTASVGELVRVLVAADATSALTPGLLERVVTVAAEAASSGTAGTPGAVTTTTARQPDGTVQIGVRGLAPDTRVVVLLTVTGAPAPAQLRRYDEGVVARVASTPLRRTVAVTAVADAAGRALLDAPSSLLGGSASAVRAALERAVLTVAGTGTSGAPAVFAVPASTTTPSTPPTLTLSSPVTAYGKGVTVSGTAAPGSTLQVLVRPQGASFRVARSVVVPADGAWAATLWPTRTTRIQVRSSDGSRTVTGPSALATVQARVSAAAARTGVRTYRFSGTTRPARPHVAITVTGWTMDGRRVAVGTTRTRPDGSWTLARRFLADGALAVVAGNRGDGVAAGGTSSVARVVVG